MPLIRHADSRRTETPNAVMTPNPMAPQGGPGHAYWRVEMRAGQAGPLHVIDTEQVWTVLDGGATVELDGQVLTAGHGDTLGLPADAPRRVSGDPAAGFAAIAVAPPGTRAYPLDGSTVSPTCAVPDGDKLVPAWVV